MGFFSNLGDSIKQITGGDLLKAGVSIGSSILGNNSASDAAEKNLYYQKEFAQNGIRWRVEDAKAAGIHPLAVLGAHVTPYQPVFQGSDFSDMGQNIQRAIDAKKTPAERALVDLQLEQARANIEQTKAQTRAADASTRASDNAIIQEALNSAREIARQQRVTPMPRVNQKSSLPPEVATYGDIQPGIVPYRIHDSYFEGPPEDLQDMLESPPMMAAYKAAIESATIASGVELNELPLTRSHRAKVKAGTHVVFRIPGYGYAVTKKGEKPKMELPPSWRKHHGPWKDR